MLTGLELAGILLAAFPIVVEGLKLYLAGIESIKRWWKYIRVLKHLIRIVGMEKVKFENTCEELLYNLVGGKELSLLLLDPGGARWRQDHLQISLRERLGRSFGAFMESVTDTKNVLDKLIAKLELDENGKPKWIDHRRYKREWKRVYFSLTEEENELFLKRLEKNNSDLEALLGHHLRIEAMRFPRSSANARRYERIREDARDLYSALWQSLTLPCGCSMPHIANLQLETRSMIAYPPTSEGSENSQGLQFNVLFSSETNSLAAKTTLWNWRDTVIEPLNDRSSGDEDTSASGIPLEHNQSTSSSLMPLGTEFNTLESPSSTDISTFTRGGRVLKSFSVGGLKFRSLRTKRVTFASSTTKPLLDTKVVTTSTRMALDSSFPKIESLCKAINATSGQSSCLGVLIDETRRQHRVSLTQTSPSSDSIQIVPLTTLLNETTRLEKKTRLILAVKLASTLLQLHDTPWLSEKWGKKDIFFVEQEYADSSAVFQKPFLSKPFASPSRILQAEDSSNTNPQPVLEVRNQSIFALGIILIELWFGRRLEDLQIVTGTGQNREANLIADFATARQLSEEVYKEAGDWYGDAVRRCMFCDFDQRHTSLQTIALKEAVHRGVIRPLEEHLRSFCGGNLDEFLVL